MPHSEDGFSRRQAIKLAGLALLHSAINRHGRIPPHKIQSFDTCETLHPDLWERLKESTGMVRQIPQHMPIRALDWKGRCGTCFHAGHGDFLTNRHVMFNGPQLEYPYSTTPVLETCIGHPAYRFNDVRSATHFNFADLALASTGVVNYTTLSLTASIPQVLDPVYSCTYQGDTLHRHGRFAIHPIRARYIGRIPIYEKRLRFPQDSIVLATDLDPYDEVPRFSSGASGAPIVDSSGNVFGVLRSTKHILPDAEKRYLAMLFNLDPSTIRSIAYAVPLNARHIRSFLESRGIKYLP